MLIFHRILLSLTLGAWLAGAGAQDSLPLPEPLQPAHCGPMEIGAEAGGDGELELEAGQMKREGDRVELSSDVRVRHGALHASADTVVINQEQERASFSSGVRMSGPGVALEAEQAELEYGQNRAEATNARYRLSSGATGQAQKLTRTPDGVLEADGASYSTCALENPAWSLKAENIRIDPNEGQGEARNAVLRVGSVPVMTLPWVGFPVGDARKSGWLMPQIGTSDDLGYSLELPYYFNLAPHYDAVLSARYMGRRGFQIKPSGRYRTHHGAGTVSTEYLSDNESDDDRYLLHWRHNAVRPNGWDYQVNYTNVSDGAYLEDFSSGIHGLSTTRLRQEARVAWRSDNWTVSAAMTGSDPLKGRSEQWDRLPQVRAAGSFRVPSTGLVLSPMLAVDVFRGNLDAVDVFEGDLDARHVEGERYDAGLTISRGFSGAGWQVTSRLQWRHTQYDLDYSNARKKAATNMDEKLDRTPSRTLPIFSIDGRMRFERQLENGALQTLEPQVFYLNRQRRDHAGIPDFDSRRFELDYDALFRGARAAGRDRIGGADLVATGLTTRVIDPVSGYLKLRAQVGRIWYFRSPGGLIKGGEGDNSKSAWAAQVEWRPVPQLQIRSALRYDPGREGNDTTWASHMIGWDGKNDERFQARYIRRAGDVEYIGEPALEQADVQALLPLGQNWQLAARYRYDLREGRDLELLSALEYRGCCMTVGIGAWKVRRESGLPGEEYENRIMLQVRFHGLAGFGEDITARMHRELDGEPAWSH
ncbi:MAG: LPS assembly protein LptD [Gammaproteobacteria bacterium]|nr:LPS assembly protein LptD [Gammaproteobacteria bacterium]